MPPPIRLLAAALAPALAGAAAVLPSAERGGRPAERVELVIENAERGRTLHVPLRRGEPFAIVTQHSMYDQPVTEEFVVDQGGRIVLEAVSSPSAAVREYFGFTTAGERHVLVRPMREIVFRVAAGTPQRLRAGGMERSFLEMGEHGDRLVMRVAPAGPGRVRR
jgi:hypothetical protein